ncbi:hypothetical protein OHA79_51575 (plasmid) [Streptomyces sp. NBC_00841]|uniref:hypothetical protein n=1 Tax=Streptomyces sp. NBC_00841 TaxID=2975847 RepID=UPI002DDA3D7A|nr:hypothetical protein [Streptomyces sp. NBC_00841]WSA05838.1 hypothetical protein OHA79_51575 [Streptomyces sp. NBC_00841]
MSTELRQAARTFRNSRTAHSWWVLGRDRLVQVQGTAADQAGAVVAGQSGQGGDGTAARLFAVAVVVSTGGAVDVQ